jgi:hypothetical protein
MSTDASGTYTLPSSDIVNGQTGDATPVQNNFDDIEAGLTERITKTGKTTYTANQPMGGFKLTNLGVGTSDSDSATFAQTTWFIPPPQGRLTLTTAVPVLATNVSAAGTVYYTPYIGNLVPIYNGTRFIATAFTELSNVLANSSSGSAGPAAGAASKNYDLFVWSDSGTLRLTRGAAWNSDTARSATTENDLTRVNGVLLNLNAITNGPAASRGTYVGTIRTDSGGATVTWHFGALAANGTAANLHVWNAYNRVLVGGLVADSTDSWSYSGGSFRPANNSSTMRVSFVNGLQEERVEAIYESSANGGGSSGIAVIAVGLDSTTSAAGSTRAMISNGNVISSFVASQRTTSLGFHYLQALENNVTAAVTFYGDNGGSNIQSGMYYSGRF